MDLTTHEKAAEGIGKVLLAPLYLIYDFTTALLPGLLFCILLIAKGTHGPTAAMGSTLFGYKTKVVLGLLLCYMIGRSFRIPIEQLYSVVLLRKLSQMTQKSVGPQAIQFIKNFFTGSMVLPNLLGKDRVLDYIVLAHTNIIFTLTTGLVLVVASAIPGDGHLRETELGVGLMMVSVVVMGLRRSLSTFATLIGAGTDLSTILGPLAKVHSALDGAQQALRNPRGRRQNHRLCLSCREHNHMEVRKRSTIARHLFRSRAAHLSRRAKGGVFDASSTILRRHLTLFHSSFESHSEKLGARGDSSAPPASPFHCPT